MSKPAADVLERVAEATGRLLRVEREPLTGPAGASGSSRLRLVFDVGGVDLSASDADALLATRPELSERLPVDAQEEEPWWSLLGSPLVRVQRHEDRSLIVQFRADAESPRIFVLEARGGGVRVSPLV